jgi:hypothetical protein
MAVASAAYSLSRMNPTFAAAQRKLLVATLFIEPM